MAVIRSALTHEAAAKVLRGFVLRRLLERVAAELDVPDPRFRAELAASHMIGIAMLRYVIEVEPLASADPDDHRGLVGPTLQRYLTEALAPGRSARRTRARPGRSGQPCPDPGATGVGSTSIGARRRTLISEGDERRCPS